MSEILDFKNNSEDDGINIETIVKNIANTDEAIVFDYTDGLDMYIAHLQNIVRLFSAFKSPERVRQLLADQDLSDWRIRDIAKIAQNMTNKPYLIDEIVDEVLKITLDGKDLINEILN
jgi:hypothetical protein